MEGIANLVVYRNGKIIQNTHEGVKFVWHNPFSFVVLYTMTLMELHNGLCQSMENDILRRVSIILYRNPVVFDIMPIIDETQMRQSQIELYVEFENVEADGIQNDLDIEDDRATVYKRMNSDSEEDFEATYEAGNEDEDGDVGVEAVAKNVVVHPSGSQPMNVPPFMRTLDLDAMHAPEFSEYANIALLILRMESSELEWNTLVIAAIRSYSISRGVNYNVYESESQTFYAKCKTYGRECDWLIRASLIRKNDITTYTMRTISHDHSKLDSDTVAEAIRPLVETDPSIKFNYTISYQKAWLTKQKSIAKLREFLPSFAMVALGHGSEDEEAHGIKILHRVFWSFNPCIRAC
ncbi:hypothetical protein Ahy_A08g040158 [Arachis hypogaea]|uniref:Transposase MuDR plant domain-containing protein n=1 Tax=Arachis hypogaea TaxID=3818 RepID=A0A445BYC0_ARAHY|nr:hypothetical protein Ahy_A08g040158 [Arachis hypogaea]